MPEYIVLSQDPPRNLNGPTAGLSVKKISADAILFGFASVAYALDRR